MFGALGAIAPICWGIWHLLKWIHEWRAAQNNDDDNPPPIFYDTSMEHSDLDHSDANHSNANHSDSHSVNTV